MGRGSWGLPVDWEGCPKMGHGLVGDIFLTFKTPLNSSLNSTIKEKDVQFFLEDVFQEVERLGVDKVLWVDLTNTSRYYAGSDVSAREGYTYLKMALPGHGLPPSPRERDAFNSAVDTFLAEFPHGIIAVHCTHGFNRTGYLISNYLIAKKGYSAHNSMSEFRIKRPPGIYRKNYVDHLYEMGAKGKGSDGEADFVPLVVEEPSWVNPRNRNPATLLNFKREPVNPRSNGNNGFSSGDGNDAANSSSMPSLFAEDELVANFDDDIKESRPRHLNPERRARIKELNWRNDSRSIPYINSYNNRTSNWDMGRGQMWQNNNQQFLQYGLQSPPPLMQVLPQPPAYHRISRQFGNPVSAPGRNHWQYSRDTGQPIPYVGYQNDSSFPNSGNFSNTDQSSDRRGQKRKYR